MAEQDFQSLRKLVLNDEGEIDFEKLNEVLPPEIDPEKLEELVELLFQSAEDEESSDEEELKSDSRYDEVTNALSGYILQVRSIERISEEEEQSLAEEAAMGNVRARNQLIEAYLPMVLSLARQKGQKREEILEFIQEGNMALVKAMGNFNFEGTRPLRDYIRWSIKKRLHTVAQQIEQSIKFPRKIRQFFERFQKAAEDLKGRMGRSPELEDIATELKIDIEELKKNLVLGSTMLGSEQNLDEGTQPVLRYVKDARTLNDQSSETMDSFRGIIARYLDILSPLEREILSMHYGLEEDGIRKDIYEISDELGLKTNHVRDLKSAAITRINRELGRIVLED